jgi:hypothetical protein
VGEREIRHHFARTVAQSRQRVTAATKSTEIVETVVAVCFYTRLRRP